MTIWQFNQTLTRRLLSWASTSISTGISLLLRGNPFQQGMGTQFVGWGVINMLIALIGGRSSRQRAAAPDAQEPETIAKETRNLRRLLWINTGLDVFYMLGGWQLARTKGKTDPRWLGQGWGIIVQGAFLFFFDLIHAVLLSDSSTRERTHD